MSLLKFFRPSRNCFQCGEIIWPGTPFLHVSRGFFVLSFGAELDPTAEHYHFHCFDPLTAVYGLGVDETISITLKLDESVTNDPGSS